MADRLVKEEDIQALWRAADMSTAARRREMPSEHAALVVMFEAWQRLRELGWRDGMCCPKDGSLFEVCGLGSTGIHKCTYSGEWPDGHAMVQDGGDIYPQNPTGLLWRPLKEKAKP